MNPFQYTANTSFVPENLSRFLTSGQRRGDKGLFDHCALRIGCNDEVWLDYFSSPELNAHTKFDMASVTKIIVTTSLTLIAMDRGLLSDQDPVSRFFPCPPEKEQMTVRHLLTHTMGIGHKAMNLPGNTDDRIASFILNIPSDAPIGQTVQYSCPGFILLGKILEQLFECRLDEAFKRLVAAPLEMTESGFLPQNGPFVNSNLDPESIGKVNDYNCRFLGGVAGNAGLFSNITDITKYVRMLLRGGAPLFRTPILEKACRNYTGHLSESRGLGFVYVDKRYAQTGGLFKDGAIGHCGHTGQSVFVDRKSGFYVIFLSDATVTSIRKYGKEDYNEVMQMRHDLHQAIVEDLRAAAHNPIF